MTRIDITGQFVGWNGLDAVITEHEVALKSDRTQYTGVVYDLHTRTMIGSYIDFPGHIKETDDGVRGDNVNLADFYGIDCAVIHLDRANCPGGISAADLEAAYGGVPDTPAVIINALGSTRSFDIPQRSVYLELDAVEWLKKTPCKLLVSDIYESQALHGVFLKLFAAGVTTVCHPVHLGKIAAREVKMTILFSKLPITQLPCRLIVEY